MQLAITAIGTDRPGIVAAVAEVLRDRGLNVEDSAMTVLGGQFAMVLLVRGEDTADALQEALRAATAPLGLVVNVAAVAEGHPPAAPTHILSVYGSDRPGILAGVARVLADAGVNITDVESRLLGEDTAPVYALVIECAVPADLEDLEQRLAAVCAELGVDHTLRALDTETY